MFPSSSSNLVNLEMYMQVVVDALKLLLFHLFSHQHHRANSTCWLRLFAKSCWEQAVYMNPKYQEINPRLFGMFSYTGFFHPREKLVFFFTFRGAFDQLAMVDLHTAVGDQNVTAKSSVRFLLSTSFLVELTQLIAPALATLNVWSFWKRPPYYPLL